jgi:hypothetical protein
MKRKIVYFLFLHELAKKAKRISFSVSFEAKKNCFNAKSAHACTSTVRDFSYRNVKIFHRTVNTPTEYKLLIISQFPHGANYSKVKMFTIQ